HLCGHASVDGERDGYRFREEQVRLRKFGQGHRRRAGEAGRKNLSVDREIGENNRVPRLTIPKLQKMKANGEKIAMVTCYDASFARLIDGLVDTVLVGDSLGMVIQGYDSTLPVTLNDMIHHSAAVARGLTHPVLVTDMPFMSYQAEFGAALKAAG